MVYGPNIDWVTLAVEAVSGKPLELYFKEHIFECVPSLTRLLLLSA